MSNSIDKISPKVVNAFLQGMKALCDFSERNVIPVLKGMIGRSDLEEALIGTFCRMQLWMQSLVKLDDPLHFQAAMTGARGIYELLVDLKLLRADPSLVGRFHDFAFVARFDAARKYVETLSAGPSVRPPTKSRKPDARLQFVADPANVKKFDDLRRSNWGKDRKGKLITPDHWSGLGMADRATKLGVQEHARYRHVYAQFSWFVHSGSAAISGISKTGLTAGFTWAHGMAHAMFAEGTELICESQRIFEATPTLRHELEVAKVQMGKVFMRS